VTAKQTGFHREFIHNNRGTVGNGVFYEVYARIL
jgi:hypothetical protein